MPIKNIGVSNFASSEYLYVNCCGTQTCTPYQRTTIRENGRKDYHILYVVGGVMEVEHAGKEYQLMPGDFVLYFPGERQRYVHRANGKTQDHWLHFSGTGAPDILNKLSFVSSGVYRADFNHLIDKCFRQMIFECNVKKPSHEIAECGHLLVLLSLLSRRCFSHGNILGMDKISPAIEHISMTYGYQPDIAHLASLCSLSKSRFMHLFKQITGTSPVKYYHHLRVEHAKEFLLQTDASISEVADAVGYTDPLYFSRVFKKLTGLSPLAYRRGGSENEA